MTPPTVEPPSLPSDRRVRRYVRGAAAKVPAWTFGEDWAREHFRGKWRQHMISGTFVRMLEPEWGLFVWDDPEDAPSELRTLLGRVDVALEVVRAPERELDGGRRVGLALVRAEGVEDVGLVVLLEAEVEHVELVRGPRLEELLQALVVGFVIEITQSTLSPVIFVGSIVIFGDSLQPRHLILRCFLHQL